MSNRKSFWYQKSKIYAKLCMLYIHIYSALILLHYVMFRHTQRPTLASWRNPTCAALGIFVLLKIQIWKFGKGFKRSMMPSLSNQWVPAQTEEGSKTWRNNHLLHTSSFAILKIFDNRNYNLVSMTQNKLQKVSIL